MVRLETSFQNKLSQMAQSDYALWWIPDTKTPISPKNRTQVQTAMNTLNVRLQCIAKDEIPHNSMHSSLAVTVARKIIAIPSGCMVWLSDNHSKNGGKCRLDHPMSLILGGLKTEIVTH